MTKNHIQKKGKKKIAADRRLQAKYHKNCCNPKALSYISLNTFLKLRVLSCSPTPYQALHCKNCPSQFTIREGFTKKVTVHLDFVQMRGGGALTTK